MTPVFFKDEADFRKWLEKYHEKKTELIVGFYKKNSGKANMTWSQSVDQALCFGWIDGVRRSIDNESYCIRFTPRRPKSIWSAVNIRKVAELKKKGAMRPSGIEAFKYNKASRSKVYSFEAEPKKLPDLFEMKFKTNKTAWDYFSRQAPSYQKMVINWIMTAKREPTRLTRLDKTISVSEKQNRIT